VDPFGAQKITTDPYILALSTECLEDRYPKLKIYLITDFRYIPIYTGSICNYALYDWTLTKLIVACFVGTGRPLIRYCNHHMK
jgi:hypothetical protein